MLCRKRNIDLLVSHFARKRNLVTNWRSHWNFSVYILPRCSALRKTSYSEFSFFFVDVLEFYVYWVVFVLFSLDLLHWQRPIAVMQGSLLQIRRVM